MRQRDTRRLEKTRASLNDVRPIKQNLTTPQKDTRRIEETSNTLESIESRIDVSSSKDAATNSKTAELLYRDELDKWLHKGSYNTRK